MAPVLLLSTAYAISRTTTFTVVAVVTAVTAPGGPMARVLDGRVALVTGASKNIGKGIALEVAASGAVTYVTARSLEDVPGQLASLNRTVAEIEALGGTAIAVACDHTDDAQVEAVFDRIRSEQGRLDLVVNVASPDFSEMVGVPFWEIPFRHITNCLEIGPRSDYVTTALAARMMIPQGSGLVVNISSHGAEGYLLSVPYGVGKAAIDKVTQDTAFELRPHGVAVRVAVAGAGAHRGPAGEHRADRGRAPRAPRARRELRGDAEVQRQGGRRPRRRSRRSSSAPAARSGPPRWRGSTASPRTTGTCRPRPPTAS